MRVLQQAVGSVTYKWKEVSAISKDPAALGLKVHLRLMKEEGCDSRELFIAINISRVVTTLSEA